MVEVREKQRNMIEMESVGGMSAGPFGKLR